MTLVWGLTCLAVGAAFLWNAGSLYRARKRFLATAVRTRATVVAVRIIGVARNAVAVPTLEFTDAAGAVRRAESLQPSGFAGAAVGATVPVRYDPAQPARVDLDGFGALWGLALLRGGFGALFGVMGAVALLIWAF